MIGFLAAGVGVFLGALEWVAKPARQRLQQVLGLAFLFYALACWHGALSGRSDPFQPLAPPASTAATQTSAGMPANDWQTVTTTEGFEQALKQASAAGQPLVLDWYADWCISCKVIEHEVLTDPRVVKELKGYRKVRMDITQSNPQQRALLDRFKLFGPPALLFFDANGNEVEVSRVVGEIGAAAFVEKIPAFNGQ